MAQLVYVDNCPNSIKDSLKELGVDVAYRLPEDKWNVNDAMGVITIPDIQLAIINTINEIAVMEMALLHFMCKPILITTSTIENYPAIKRTVVDYIEPTCNLMDRNNNFLSWYKMNFGRNNG